MSGTGSRKIKITYLIPSTIGRDKLSSQLVSNYLNVGFSKVDLLKVVYFEHAGYTSPAVFNSKGEPVSLYRKSDPSGAIYYNGISLFKDYSENMEFIVQVLKPSPVIFSTFERNGEQYYQLAIEPNSFWNQNLHTV